MSPSGAVWPVLLLTPSGWVVEALRRGVGDGEPAALLWLAPASALIASLPWTSERLRRRHRIAEVVFSPTGFAVARFENEPESFLAGAWAPRLAESPAEVAEPVTAAELAVGPSRRTGERDGVIERTVIRALRPREHALLGLLLADLPRWTRSWKIGASLCLAALAFGLALPFTTVLAAMVAGAGLLLCCPAHGGIWTGFEPRISGSRFVPMLGAYPVGYGEASRTMLKVNGIRLATALPLALVAGVPIARAFGLPYADGPLVGVRIWLIALAVQPLVVTMQFAGATNDTRSPFFAFEAFVAIFLTAALAPLGALVALVATEFTNAVLGLVLVASTSWVVLIVYGLAWGRPLFDLTPAD